MDVVKEIREKACFNVDRVNEIEETTHHDVIAFVSCVAENVGDASKYIHFGLTSSDVLDTGLALQLACCWRICLRKRPRSWAQILQRRSLEHRDTVMIGRTHGVHAEPITFGMVLGLWAFEIQRGLERLGGRCSRCRSARSRRRGHVTPTSTPQVEQITMAILDLGARPFRRRSSSATGTPNSCRPWRCWPTTLEKIALQIRHYQRTEVLEAEEYFAPGQKGSSAMPHKRNPIISERICGQARIIRSNLMAAIENVALWHERDISHSSAERVILPDSTILFTTC